MTKKYTIGIDFGTLSGRALLVDQDGAEIADAVMEYPHGVMDAFLPDGTPLPPDFALQHPQDYLDVLGAVIPAVLEKAGVAPRDVVGVGVDFTACTMLAVKEDGTPLCFLPEFAGEPHAWAKLWKHHAAQAQADRITALAEARGEAWLARYGGRISSEWLFPKILETLEKAPAVYEAADRFIEAGDWIVWRLTGRETHNACAAGYKAIWSAEEGYPPREFFAALDARLADVVGTKVSREVIPIGTLAGRVTPEAAARTGLCPGTAVAAAEMDAHVAFAALGITEPGRMLLIIGTSGCHMVMGERAVEVPGACGIVRDGILPGYYGYEAGQCCVGDHFDWFVHRCVPGEYWDEARAAGVSIHRILREKASRLAPGGSGLLALDWWNGNRSVLVDAQLSGMMLGMTLRTKPEEMYRALLEAVAYGTRMIIDTFERCGVPVTELLAGGGIAEKDPLMMQIYADVTGRAIRLSGSSQAPALASAIHGAAAAGLYPSLAAAAKAMGRLRDVVYTPDPASRAVYEKLYAEYVTLHDYFGRGANDVMKRLRRIAAEA